MRTLVVGGVHAATLALLTEGEREPVRRAVVSAGPEEVRGGGGGVVGVVSVPYVKWVLEPEVTGALLASSSSSSSSAGEGKGGSLLRLLPEGYCFGTLRREELGRVVASTEIPRREATMGAMRNVCVRKVPLGGAGDEEGEGKVVAWGFLGLDGSLTSLFCEAEERGRGFAKAIARRLFGEEGGWGHSDVSIGNEASEGVMRGLGGRKGWEVFWIRVDLEALGEESQGVEIEGGESRG